MVLLVALYLHFVLLLWVGVCSCPCSFPGEADRSDIMGVLDLMLSWVNRVVILVSVVLLTLTSLRKQADIPLSQASLRVGHLCAFRCVRYPFIHPSTYLCTCATTGLAAFSTALGRGGIGQYPF